MQNMINHINKLYITKGIEYIFFEELKIKQLCYLDKHLHYVNVMLDINDIEKYRADRIFRRNFCIKIIDELTEVNLFKEQPSSALDKNDFCQIIRNSFFLTETHPCDYYINKIKCIKHLLVDLQTDAICADDLKKADEYGKLLSFCCRLEFYRQSFSRKCKQPNAPKNARTFDYKIFPL